MTCFILPWSALQMVNKTSHVKGSKQEVEYLDRKCNISFRAQVRSCCFYSWSVLESLTKEHQFQMQKDELNQVYQVCFYRCFASATTLVGSQWKISPRKLFWGHASRWFLTKEMQHLLCASFYFIELTGYNKDRYLHYYITFVFWKVISKWIKLKCMWLIITINKYKGVMRV